MKIAFVVGEFPALSETFILRQITGLIERGHDVDIFARKPRNDPISHADIDRYRLLERTCYLNGNGSGRSKLSRVAGRLGLLVTHAYKNPVILAKTLNVGKFGKSALRFGVLHDIAPFVGKGPYDIIHCQFGMLGNLGLLLKDTGVLRSKLVTSFLGYDISSYLKRRGQNVYRNLFDRGDLFLPVSEHMKAKLVGLGCDPRKIIVHRLGTELNTASAPTAEPTCGGKLTILTIARLVGKKGVEYGIRAVAKILPRHPEITYNIIGEGALRDKLQRLIEELNAAATIKLLGWKNQAEVADLLKTSDILLAPSVTTETGDEEGTPVVIMEAFAHGLPVVSTYHAGIPEVVKDGESGFLVPERDIDGLAEKLEKLIETPELRFVMSRKGRAFVEKHYDIDRLNDRLVSIYQSLLAA